MPHQQKVLKTPLRISITIILFGILMRVLQVPHASEVLLVAFAGTGLMYLVRFWNKHEKKFLDYIKLILVVSWTANGVLRSLNFTYILGLQIVIALMFIIWFVMEGTAYFLDEDRKAKNSGMQLIWNFTMVIGSVSIIAGSLLNLLDWQYGIPLLVIGITLIAIYILKDLFTTPKAQKKGSENEEYQL